MSVDFETLYPKLVHLLLDPVFVVDENGTIVFISNACERLLGYTADEMNGTPMVNYLYPDDKERTLAAAKRVMEGRFHIDFENRYVHKLGHLVHILWSARWSAEDRVRIAVARDVTALRRADQLRDALYQISQAAHAAESLQALCENVHQVLGQLFSTDNLYVALYDHTQNALSYPYVSINRHMAWVDGPLQDDTAISEVIRGGRALLATRDLARPGLGITSQAKDDVSSWLGVPLVSGDRVLGAVVIEGQSPEECHSEEDRDLLEFVATQMVTAIERKQVEERLRFMAHHDHLTGLTNRSLFYDRLETALRTARRNKEQVALLYLDLNGFKEVNDSQGHELGDRMLQEVAHRLERCSRASDTVARMGGDEFTVLLTGVFEQDAVDEKVEQIREALAHPMYLNGVTLTVSCSIGSAIFPDDSDNAEQLLSRADTRMYEMKRAPAPL